MTIFKRAGIRISVFRSKKNKLKPFNKIGFVYLQEFKPSGWMFLKDFQVLYLQRWIFLKV